MVLARQGLQAHGVTCARGYRAIAAGLLGSLKEGHRAGTSNNLLHHGILLGLMTSVRHWELVVGVSTADASTKAMDKGWWIKDLAGIRPSRVWSCCARSGREDFMQAVDHQRRNACCASNVRWAVSSRFFHSLMTISILMLGAQTMAADELS